ncbi:hypothetical protein Q8F55_000467 [Vanrija albida]|uniref:Shugoshin C-terminal domain-containing protein n=1 Tax=Vanrija albida TaxID=181172 RepID=A0ABR3QDC3_9TREE
MPPRAALADQLAALRNELELSTFLNKGVLQSNAEHKLRIAELEAENGALRAAESRLAATEDALEAAEARLTALEEAKRRLGERRDAALSREVGLRRAAEGERDAWRRHCEALADVVGRAGALLAEAAAAGVEAPPTPLSVSLPRGLRSWQLPNPPASLPPPKTKRASSPLLTRRNKRRIDVLSEDDDDDDEPLPPEARRTPRSAPHSAPSTTRRRPPTPHAPTPLRRRRTDVAVKNEPESDSGESAPRCAALTSDPLAL